MVKRPPCIPCYLSGIPFLPMSQHLLASAVVLQQRSRRFQGCWKAKLINVCIASIMHTYSSGNRVLISSSCPIILTLTTVPLCTCWYTPSMTTYYQCISSPVSFPSSTTLFSVKHRTVPLPSLQTPNCEETETALQDTQKLDARLFRLNYVLMANKKKNIFIGWNKIPSKLGSSALLGLLCWQRAEESHTGPEKIVPPSIFGAPNFRL